MPILSTLSNIGRVASAAVKKRFLSKDQNALVQALRKMSDDKTMYITPSRYQYTRFKDDLHFFISLGVIPLGLIILYTNIFIGKSTLAEIPEGYQPRHWEYYQHPITRFMVKHFMDDPQVHYEKVLHNLWEVQEKKAWRAKIDKANELMATRDDYKAWYYVPSEQGRNIRYARKEIDDLEARKGYR